MQARAIRPSRGLDDRRRVVAAFLSSLVPGLGQAFNRDARFIAVFVVPFVAIVAVGAALWNGFGDQLMAIFFQPDAILAVLVLNAILLAWRLLAVGQAFTGAARGPVGRIGIAGFVLVAGWTMVPQVAGGMVGMQVYDAARAICVACSAQGTVVVPDGPSPTPLFSGDDPGSTGGPTPEPQGRINVLLLGIDSRPTRSHALADTIIVASIDPTGKTVSMLSIPRDMVDVPLPNGKVYRPKINSLLGYVNSHPDDPAFEWAGGSGTRALQDAIGELLGIPVHYYAKVDLQGFIRVVDAVGGIDVNVRRPLVAGPLQYRDFGVRGFRVDKGVHHFNGAEALAYARIRKAAGESDFTRAERQQQVLWALRNKALEGGALDLLARMPSLLDALKGAVRTDVPPDRFDELAFLAEAIGRRRATNVVIRSPLVRSGQAGDPRGSIQVPDVVAIRAMAAKLFPPPGEIPTRWPTPRPTTTPSPSPSDSGSG